MDQGDMFRQDASGSGKVPNGNGNGTQLYRSRPRVSDETMYADDIMEGDEEEDVSQVAMQGRELLARYIEREMAKTGDANVSASIRRQIDISQASTRNRLAWNNNNMALRQQEEIVQALGRIGDALEMDVELNSLIKNVPPEATWETFQKVAKVLFAEGVNWGRIVALFFFACKMIRQSLNNIPMIQYVLDWGMKIIRIYLAQWVLRRGGWRAVAEYFGPTWSQIGIAFGAAGVIYAVFAGCKSFV